MTRRLRSALLAATAAATLVSPDAHAEPSAIQLTWQAPAGCPSGDAVLASVAQIVDGKPLQPMTVRADVSQEAAGHWSVRLVTDIGGATGERTVEASSCEALVTATALILAWSAGPWQMQPPQPSPPVAPPAPVPSAPPQPDPAPQPKPPPRRGPQAIVVASGAVDFGSLPSAGLGGELGAGVLFRPLRVEVTVADWLAQSATSGTDGTRLHFVDVTARGCYVIPLRRALDLSSCFGGGLAWASSTGFGESRPENQTALWGLFRADAIVAWSVLPNVALRVSAGTLVPVAPPSFVALHGAITSSVLHQPSAIAGRGGLGVEARFP